MKKYLIPIIAGLLISGSVYAATVLFPQSGGTGISTIPTYGQMLVGNSGGTYTLTATSSLGISSGSSAFPFSQTQNFGINTNSTTTALSLFGGVYASSTSQMVNLNIYGNLGLPSLTSGGLAVNSLGIVYKSATTTFSSPLVYTNGDVACPSCILTSRNINTTYPLQGGGALSGDLTLSTDFGTTTANNFSALQTFVNASSTLISSDYASSTQGYFGTVYIPSLGTAAGTFLAANASGQVIPTSTPPTGGISSLLGNSLTKGNFLVGNDSGLSQATSSIFVDSKGQIGIGLTNPANALDVVGNIKSNLIYSAVGLTSVNNTLNSFRFDPSVSPYSPSIRTNGINRLIVDDNGNVGIGTSTPLSILTVYGGNTSLQTSTNSTTAFQVLNAATSSVLTVDTTSGRLTSVYASTTALTVSQSAYFATVSGNVGIGTTTPAKKFAVDGDAYIGGTITNTNQTATGTIDFSSATVKQKVYPAFSVASTSLLAGTTTIPLGVSIVQETWNQAACFTDTGTAMVQFVNSSLNLNDVAASTASSTVTLNTNNVFPALSKRYANIGTLVSAPNWISCTVDKTVNN